MRVERLILKRATRQGIINGRIFLCFLGYWTFLAFNTPACIAQSVYANLSASKKKLYNEHILEGQPDGEQVVYVRQGYVMRYQETYRIPEWVAYHVIPDYLKTPKREKKYKTFRTDPEIKNPVKDEDFTGTGYARGHMAPYFVMGGDRDHNHHYANALDDTADPYDDNTVFEANYMSNITPQDQDALNGPGGPWYALETAIRNKFVGKHKMELHVFTGAIINDPDDYWVLENKQGITDIAVPDFFYQILIYKINDSYITAAFLFPHVENKEDLPHADLLNYLVTVDEIEARTKLDFLNKLDSAEQHKIESVVNREFWEQRMN